MLISNQIKRTPDIKACPVCGRLPKIRFGIDLEGYARIFCKPLFRTHLEVEQYSSNNDRALYFARQKWNRDVIKYKPKNRR